MALVAFSPQLRTPEQARAGLLDSCNAIRASIADAGSVREAFAIYQHVSWMSAQLLALTDVAGQRCEQLLEEL